MVTGSLDLDAPASKRIARTYTGKDGYVASRPRSMVGLDAITGDSRNVLIAPESAGLIGRLGRATQFEAVPAVPVGLLDSKWAAKPRRLVALSSPSLTDGYPTPLLLLTNEATDKRHGQLWFRSSNAGLTQDEANHEFGQEFSATTYPVSAGGVPKFKMIPIPYITQGSAGATKATGLTRCATAVTRRYVASGSRNLGFFGQRVYSPGFHCCPFSWDRQWNDKTSAAPNTLRAGPWGASPPLWCPTKSANLAAGGTSDQNWRSGDAYYLSVAFGKRDGSWSKPFAIRPVGTVTTQARGGLIIVGDGTTATFHQSVTYDYIPVGGPDVDKRAILRTYKTNINTVASAPDGFGLGQVVDIPQKLYLVEILNDNTRTTYVDQKGSDGSLEDAEVILGPKSGRHKMWPPAASVVGSLDGRVVLGRHRPNPCGVILAPSGITASRDLNQPDDAIAQVDAGAPNSIYGVRALAYRIYKDLAGAFPIWKPAPPWQDWGQIVLQLVYFAGFPAAPAVTTIIMRDAPAGDEPAYSTIGSVVDQINETVVGGAGKEWAAQLVPGLDPDTPSTALAYTEFLVQCADLTTGSAVTSRTLTCVGPQMTFEDVAIGMGVRLAAGGGAFSVTDLIVTAKASDSSITIARPGGGTFNVTAGVAPHIAFFVDTGDNGLTSGALRGYVRSFGGSFWAPIALKASYLETVAKTDLRSLFITGITVGGSELSPDEFFNDPVHRRGPPATAGVFMGEGSLNTGGIACYSNAIYEVQNRKDGNSGEDVDYHFFDINPKRGCISPYGIVQGDGWIGYPTREGYCVVDASREEVIITGALWDPSSKIASTGHASRGLLSYEVERSGASADSDGDDYGFHAWLVDHRLFISYRYDAATRYTQCYDFSQGASASGLNEVLLPGRKPRPWSPPLTYPVVCGGNIGSNSATSPPRHMACVDTNAGSTGDGQIELLETGTTDNGVAFAPIAYYAMDLVGGLRRKHRIRRVTPYYRSRATGLKLLCSIDNARATQQAIDCAVNAEDDPAEAIIPAALRKYAEVSEFGFRDDAVDADRSELFRIEAEFEVANT